MISCGSPNTTSASAPARVIAVKAPSNASAWCSSTTCRDSFSASAATVRLWSSGTCPGEAGLANTAMRVLGHGLLEDLEPLPGEIRALEAHARNVPPGRARLATNPCPTGS